MKKFNPFSTYRKGEQFNINGEIYEALIDLEPCGNPPFLHVRSADWTNQLDGTWENGVWCMCWDSLNMPTFSKVLSFHNGMYGTYESAWNNATPLPQDLANQLEALSKETKE